MDSNGSSLRKRVVTACNRCRRRKRRCDTKKPQCGLCQAAHTECQYSDTLVWQNSIPVSRLTEQRLDASEDLLRPKDFQASFNNSTGDAASASPSGASNQDARVIDSPVSYTSTVAGTVAFASEQPGLAQGMDENAQDIDENWNVMTIPYGHFTTTNSLLSMPRITALLGQHPKELFLETEIQRAMPRELSLDIDSLAQRNDLVVDRAITDPLVDRYLASLNTIHPVLDAGEFQVFYDTSINKQSEDAVAHALCLVVLALAKVSSCQPIVGPSSWMPGIEYFAPALKIIINHALISFEPGLALSQSLYLAALYYSHLARPLQAWRLVHMASSHAQRLWIRCKQGPNDATYSEMSEATTRLLWAIFILECDIIAEYHLPRSGIEIIVEHLPFPNCGHPPQDHMLFWLADISARRLLNRVHHVMYQENSLDFCNGRLDAVTSSFKVSDELRRQLDTWHDYLPQQIRPDISSESLTVSEAILVLRYHASGDIISRPFVIHVCSLPDGVQPSEDVLDKCKLCIHHCCRYLEVFEKRLTTPCASTGIVLHSALAVVVILTLASLSPILRPLVGNMEELRSKAVRQMERWSFPGSSIECMLSILQILNLKLKLLQGMHLGKQSTL